MSTTYTVTPLDPELFRESLRGLELEELRSLVDGCRECVLGYTPEMLRDAIGLSHAYATFLADTFHELQELVDGDALDWDGFAEPMVPAAWLGAMLYVAEAMSKYSPDFVHPLETAYPAFLASKAAAKVRRPLHIAQTAPAPEELPDVAVKNQALAVAAEVEVDVGADTGEDLEVKIARIDAERKAKRKALEDERERRKSVMRANAPFTLVDENDLSGSTPVQAGPVQSENGAARALYMPVIPEGSLQLSHLVTRCGLVSTGAKGKKRQRWFANNPLVIKNVSGFAEGSVEIRYSGEELRIGDIELWAKLLDLGRLAVNEQGNPLPMGASATTGERELLLKLNRGTGGTAFETVRNERTRLQEGMLHIRATDPAFIAQAALLFPEDKAVQDAVAKGYLEIRTHLLGGDRASTGVWTVEIPRAVRSMFGTGFSSWFDEATYYSIKRDQARRLYLLYASHVSCFALSLPELKSYLGSTYAKDGDLRDAMDLAHDELVRAGVIRGWAFKQPDKRRLTASCYEVQRRYKAKRTVDA